MSKPRLRVLAVSAPHWPIRPPNIVVRSLTAGTPFSLQNAVRAAAGQASRGEGAWADSNWDTLEKRQGSVLLLEFMDEAADIFRDKLDELEPNLLLIGAMTLGMPGAVELAQIARKRMGNKCLIVLGGKHCNETLGSPLGNGLRREPIKVHPINPLSMQTRGLLPSQDGQPLFDLVVAGEGEDIISRLGEMVHGSADNEGNVCDSLRARFAELKSCVGHWAAGWVVDQRIVTISQTALPLNFASVPTAPSVFGLQSRFPVFGGIPTGHAYSDMGLGCRYDCFFCSERSSLNGKLRKHGAADRLRQHLEDIWKAGGEGKRGPVSAFVEDSILLGGDEHVMKDFIEISQKAPLLHLQVGCQMTVNDVDQLHKKGILKELATVGVNYVALGMETVNEGVASRMSKHSRHGLWTEASRVALDLLNTNRLRAGVYVLWGLGESQLERIHQLEQLTRWQEQYGGQPCAIGLNWATVHPAMFEDEGRCPDFLEWGVDKNSRRLSFFVELFGEASERYAYRPGELPSSSEIVRLHKLYLRLLGQSSCSPISNR